MGYYIDEKMPCFGKAEALIELYGAERITLSEAFNCVNTDAVVCVVRNPAFEAAGFAYDADELRRFSYPHDLRAKCYLRMDRAVVCGLTGYQESLV